MTTDGKTPAFSSSSRPLSTEERRRIRSLREEGKSIREISRMTGRSATSVMKYLKQGTGDLS